MGDFKTLRSGSVAFTAIQTVPANVTNWVSANPILLTFESCGSKASKTHTVAIRLKRIRWMGTLDAQLFNSVTSVPDFHMNQFLYGNEIPNPGWSSAWSSLLSNSGFGHSIRGYNYMQGNIDATHTLSAAMYNNPVDTDLGGRIWPFWELWAFMHLSIGTLGGGVPYTMHNSGELYYDYVEVPNITFQQIIQEQMQQTVKEVSTGVIA